MMMNLFSSFDPTTSKNLALNWISIWITIIILPFSYWMIPSRSTMLLMLTFKLMKKELSSTLSMKSLNSNNLLIAMFLMILIMNFSSLFPFIFPCTSQMSLSLSLALPFWLSFMIFGWTKNYMSMMTHLVPQGTPPILMPFMVCIESISNIIRPITLSVRLSANMIAGHLLLTLIGSTGNILSTKSMPIMLIVQLTLVILETAVSIIQSYVFIILMSLYSSET